MSVYRVRVEGKEYQVEVGDLQAQPVRVVVNGRVVQVSSASLESSEGAERGTRADANVSAISVRAASGASLSEESSELEVLAPMPGSIVSVEVESGSHVVVGQDLCILDAMKMNNRIRAQREGVISQVHVQPGDQVQHGDRLVTFAES